MITNNSTHFHCQQLPNGTQESKNSDEGCSKATSVTPGGQGHFKTLAHSCRNSNDTYAANKCSKDQNEQVGRMPALNELEPFDRPPIRVGRILVPVKLQSTEKTKFR